LCDEFCPTIKGKQVNARVMTVMHAHAFVVSIYIGHLVAVCAGDHYRPMTFVNKVRLHFKQYPTPWISKVFYELSVALT
jgi:hypothetical protein